MCMLGLCVVVCAFGCTARAALRAYSVDPASAAAIKGGADCHSHSTAHWIIGHPNPISNPMSIYPDYKKHRTSWGIDALGTVVAEVELSNGILGWGVSIGGLPACYIIENHLSRFVEGQDPHNIELMWDQMWRGTINYGRKGLPIQAISAVDIALWDALGKLKQEPVYNLLGGKTKQRLPVYATTSRPDLAKKLGFVGAKFPLPYGPGDGDQGMKKNIEKIKEVRESVGPDFPIMVDCYMSLTVPYILQLLQEAAPYKVKWFEEFLPPDQYDGYKQVRDRNPSKATMLTCGEHEYSRWGFRQLIENGCVDIIQPDITWCGGITEARRVIGLASTFDVAVIPHGSSIYSFHLQYAFVNTPMAETIIMSPDADEIVPYFGALFTDEPLPKDGSVTPTSSSTHSSLPCSITTC